MTSSKLKVILDTDIGNDIDDALAVAYLLNQPRCELMGVTTVSAQPALRCEMVSAICRHVGRDDVPIHAGSGESLLIKRPQQAPPQALALGERPRRRNFAPATALEFMRQTIRTHPGEITLLAIGPMTNLALLFAADPEIPSLLKQVVLMCGRFFQAGGEWNAINDPHASAIVYGNGQQTRPPQHVSFGLDVTLQCAMEAAACRARFTARVLQPVRDFAEVWFHRAGHVVFHDPLAAACLFEPDLCRYRRGEVRVPLDGPTAGWTVFGEQPADGPHQVAVEVDDRRFLDHYFQIVGS